MSKKSKVIAEGITAEGLQQTIAYLLMEIQALRRQQAKSEQFFIQLIGECMVGDFITDADAYVRKFTEILHSIKPEQIDELIRVQLESERV